MGVCTSDCSTGACLAGFDCKQEDSLGTKVCVKHSVSSGSGCSAAPSSPRGWWLLLVVVAGLR